MTKSSKQIDILGRNFKDNNCHRYITQQEKYLLVAPMWYHDNWMNDMNNILDTAAVHQPNAKVFPNDMIILSLNNLIYHTKLR